MQDYLMLWGIPAFAAIMGVVWLRNSKTAFLAWPAFGIAGMLVGLFQNSVSITKWAIGLTMLAIVGQIFFSSRKRGR